MKDKRIEQLEEMLAIDGWVKVQMFIDDEENHMVVFGDITDKDIKEAYAIAVNNDHESDCFWKQMIDILHKKTWKDVLFRFVEGFHVC